MIDMTDIPCAPATSQPVQQRLHAYLQNIHTLLFLEVDYKSGIW